MKNSDYVVDADTVTAKLGNCGAGTKEMPLISSMGTGNKLHPELFEIRNLSKTTMCPRLQSDAKRTQSKKCGI